LLRAAAAGDREGAEAAVIAVREEQRPAAACGREAWRKGRLYFLSPSTRTVYRACLDHVTPVFLKPFYPPRCPNFLLSLLLLVFSL
jgi:hypothetical protein